MTKEARFSRRQVLSLTLIAPFAAACSLRSSNIIAPVTTTEPNPTPMPQATPNNALLTPRRSPILGFRNDLPELMGSLPGASFVRIAGDRDRFEKESLIKQAIDAAIKQKLDIYYTDNPQEPITVPRIRQKIDTYLNYAKGNIKVVGSTNEVDDAFWKGSFATVSPFILVQSDYIFNRYGIRVAIGGLADTAKTGNLIHHLRNPDYSLLPDFDLLPKEEREYIQTIKFHPERYIYTFHAYYGPSSVTEAIEVLRDTLTENGIKDPVIWGEEIGKKNDQSVVSQMLDTALEKGAGAVMVHELSNVEYYGFMDFVNGSWVPNKYYSGIFNWSQSHLN